MIPAFGFRSGDQKDPDVSYPYIIWTMRRTGGTTLAALLATLSEHPGVAHEPFNPDRLFGAIATAWAQDPDPERLHAELTEVLARRPLIKHCYELHPAPFNEILLEVATGLGYRHMVLDSRAEVDRIQSLELAKITGVWGPDEAEAAYDRIARGEEVLAPIPVPQAVQHMRFCASARARLTAQFDALGVDPHVVFFEDVYAGPDPEAGISRVYAILRFLEIDPKAHPKSYAMIVDALTNKGQKTRRIMDAVPNLDEAQAALCAEMPFEGGHFRAS